MRHTVTSLYRAHSLNSYFFSELRRYLNLQSFAHFIFKFRRISQNNVTNISFISWLESLFVKSLP